MNTNLAPKPKAPIVDKECEFVLSGLYTTDCSNFDCCDCGGNDCGCRYCFSCNACEHCKNKTE